MIAVITQAASGPYRKYKHFFWFRGGATLIIDPREGQEKLRYSIIKERSDNELRNQQHDKGYDAELIACAVFRWRLGSRRPIRRTVCNDT